MNDKPKKTDLDYERGALLLKVQSLAAAAGPALSGLAAEAGAELMKMNEAAIENAKVRAEEAKVKADKEAADAKAKAEADAKKAEADSAESKAAAPKLEAAPTYTSDTPPVERKY